MTRPQATYQRRTETLEKELQVSRAERENLQQLVEELKAQLRHTETASLPRGYKLSGAAGGQRYYSWQVTDIDDAIVQHKRSKSERTGLVNGDVKPGDDDDTTPTATPTPSFNLDQGVEWELGEEPEAMTSHLMSMLESQVSKLDKQLE